MTGEAPGLISGALKLIHPLRFFIKYYWGVKDICNSGNRVAIPNCCKKHLIRDVYKKRLP